jgi:hypothetical protein
MHSLITVMYSTYDTDTSRASPFTNNSLAALTASSGPFLMKVPLEGSHAHSPTFLHLPIHHAFQFAPQCFQVHVLFRVVEPGEKAFGLGWGSVVDETREVYSPWTNKRGV